MHNRVIGLRHHIDATDTLETEDNMTIDTIAAFKSIATAHNAGLTALDIINGQIEALRKAKITFGKSKATCNYRTQCLDAYKVAFPNKSKKTLDNYVTAVVAAVNDGVEFSFSASKGKTNGSKDDATTKKSTPKSDVEKMVGALLTVWKLSDVGNDVLIQIETAMVDGTPLIDAIEDVLRFHGAELAE